MDHEANATICFDENVWLTNCCCCSLARDDCLLKCMKQPETVLSYTDDFGLFHALFCFGVFSVSYALNSEVCGL